MHETLRCLFRMRVLIEEVNRIYQVKNMAKLLAFVVHFEKTSTQVAKFYYFQTMLSVEEHQVGR